MMRIDRLGSIPDLLSLRSALARCKSRGTQIQTIIDVGASNGCWSMTAKDFFPNAYCFLFEAQSCWEAALQQLKASRSDVDYLLAVAGEKSGDVYFLTNDPLGGVALYSEPPSEHRRLPCTTIDLEVEKRKLQGPFLLKLDTHGFEKPIFEGAEKTLKQTELIVVETYNFNIAPTCLRFHEIIAYLETKGFRCVDMCDPMWRPLDQALWQFDLFFIPASHPLFKANYYVTP
jgi:FkbM family methyltransferase